MSLLPFSSKTTTAITQAAGNNTTKIANTSFVTTAINNAIAGVNPAVAVQAATTLASNTSGFTYNNGVSGIGATFTGTANTAVVIDGFTFTTLGQRLLVKNDTQTPSGAFNGVYYVTQLQTAILPPILTRALDYDMPSDINNTGAIPVVNGTLNGSTSWVLTSTVATVGTDPLTFTKFSLNPTTIFITAGTGLTGTGTNTVSLTTPVAIANGGTNNTTFTQGSVIFMGASALSQDNTNFFWDTSLQKLNLISANVSGTGAAAALSLTANSLTTGTGLYIVSTSLTTGALVNVVPTFNNAGGTNGYGIKNIASDATTNTTINYGYYGEINLSGNAAKNAHGMYVKATSSSTTADTIYGIESSPQATGNITSGTRSVYAFLATPIVLAAGSGTSTTNVRGFYISVTATLTSDAGTMNGYGLYIDTPTMDTNGASTAYGIFVKTQSGADNNYSAILGDTSASKVGIGIAAPGGTLSIVSNSTTGVTTSAALSLSANSLTTGTGFYLASSTLTSGLGVDIQISGTAAAASQTAFNILTAGATATNAITTYGAQISNTHTNATSGTNIALYLNASGATTANYGLIVNAGSVGIGTTAPGALLDVLGSSTGRVLIGMLSDVTTFGGVGFATTLSSANYSIAASNSGDTLLNSTTGHAMGFRIANIEKMRIDTTGNVGINVTGPSTALQVGGIISPDANKTRDLGTTSLRFNSIFYVAATTGTSRLCESKTVCSHCNIPMMRGTGTNILLGETADYISTFCTLCGRTGIESWSHLPREALSERKPAPMIKIKAITAQQMSGNSRTIKVDFQYGEDIYEDNMDGIMGDNQRLVLRAPHNSTILGETELAAFLTMDIAAQQQFLLGLGQREWDSMEEIRLMEQEVIVLQETFDKMSQAYIGTDLLLVKQPEFVIN